MRRSSALPFLQDKPIGVFLEKVNSDLEITVRVYEIIKSFLKTRKYFNEIDFIAAIIACGVYVRFNEVADRLHSFIENDVIARANKVGLQRLFSEQDGMLVSASTGIDDLMIRETKDKLHMLSSHNVAPTILTATRTYEV